MYDLVLSSAAGRYFKKIREHGLKKSLSEALNNICNNPYIGELKTGDLSGLYGYDVYYKGTNYEIAYKIYEEGENLIVVILAGTRENFYEELKRYINN